jgi:hypothetical protein
MLYNQGIILTNLQWLLGHKSVLTIERYFGMKFEETREAILLLEEPLIQALSVSAIGKPITQLPEATSETIEFR